MHDFFKRIYGTYEYVFYDLADPRSKDWWGVSSPIYVVVVVTSYLYFCNSLGPRLMKNREPFQLKTLIAVYNLLQVLLSAYIVFETTLYFISDKFSFSCQLIEFDDNPDALRMLEGIWWYYFAKLTELLDTIFFVLRKKRNQITFLHLYHHAGMYIMMWLAIKFFPGGQGIFMGYLNAIVHVIMYTYYLISGLGPQYQKYIWWKKYVTKIQLIQFVFILLHQLYAFFTDCMFPKWINVVLSINALAFIYMFGMFYIESYRKAKKD